MIQRAANSPANKFIVGTEIGILHRLQKQNPDKQFIPISSEMSCMFMKMITLEKLHRSLKEDVFEVTVDDTIANQARKSIERMISIF
jgi:quinolinate synthase